MADINPTSMASALATVYTQGAQDLITAQATTAKNQSTALNKLKAALSAFDTALKNLSGKKSVIQNMTSVSQASVVTASASATAQPGSYAFFVEQLASVHQVAFEDLPAVPVALGGPLVAQLADGSSININLQAADQDDDGILSQSEIARAINQSPENQGKVTAMVMTIEGKTQLVLSSGTSGERGAITLDASGLPAGALKDALGAPRDLVAAKDAVVWLGAEGTGMRIQQAGNVFDSIPGVSLTFTQAMSSGSAPVSVTVAQDDSGTASNVQAFVDAYNALKKVLDDLTAKGNAESGVSAAVFASDAGIRSLRSRLAGLVREDFGGQRLMDFGVSIDRSGTMSLNSTKLKTALSANPAGLDTVFGSASYGNSSGLLGSLSTYAGQWTNSTTGYIKNRQDSVQRTQTALTARQARLDETFSQTYERYLKQFTQLQSLQAQMTQTSGIFDNLSFGTS